MRKIILILLCFPVVVSAQNTDTADHVSDGEYFGLIYRASTHKAYNFLGLIPALCTGQPTYVGEVYGGPHDALCIDQNGNLYGTGLNSGGELGIGSQTATGSGAFVSVPTDSAGNTITGVSQVLNTGTNFGTFWTTAIVMNGVLELAGNLQGGLRGAGTAGAAVNTKFVPVTFAGGAYIKKVTGLYTLLALDTIGGVRVWSWGGNNNLAQLGRGSSPSPNYESPGLITLPGGRHAVDIAGAGAYAVILLDDGEMLGIGDHPTFWGGSGQGSSNSPQNFSSFFYTYVKTAAGTEDTVKKVFANDGSLYYLTYDSTLWSMGDNICGTIGNGQMANWATYTFAPAPTGGTLAPWAYDNGYGPTGVGELPVYTPYNVAPGTHNWECGYPNTSNCWFTHFVNNKHETWGWGRDKAGQLVDSIGSCNYTSGGLNGSRPDVPDNPWPHIIKPFTWSSVTQVNCPMCFTNPSFDANCSQCSQTQGTAPTVNAGTAQVLSGNTTSTTLAGVVTGAGSTKIFNLHYSFVSSTNGSVPVITFPGSLTTPVSGLQPGVTYTLQLTATDQVSVSNTSNMTITVGTTGIGPIIKGSTPNVVSLDSVYHHTILAPTTAYYVLDTLSLPPNSQGVFNLSYASYDTVQKFTGIGQQTVMVSRISTTYGAPYISYQSPYITTGLSVHQSEYNVTLVNGLPLVRVSGFGPANPIRWHVMRHQNIMPL
jgi:alpha-tubulin suppressor-like RCC1 family protein